jgi:hypothetical protein
MGAGAPFRPKAIELSVCGLILLSPQRDKSCNVPHYPNTASPCPFWHGSCNTYHRANLPTSGQIGAVS